MSVSPVDGRPGYDPPIDGPAGVRVSPQQELLPLRLGIDTHQEPVIYMRDTCPVCYSEGFTAQSRVLVRAGERRVIATLNVVHGDWLSNDRVGLSESAWRALRPEEGEPVRLTHAPPVASMAAVRGKIYGRRFSAEALRTLMADMVAGRLTDVEIAAFVTACGGDNLDGEEVLELTRAMISSGGTLQWDAPVVADKHCVGGLPGNRTTPLVVAIVAANGLLIPKTSSRAITSPAGTADTMETLTDVSLGLARMRQVVEREGGCMVWGGAVHLSPADDILIRIERALDIDSPSQLVASVLSKKAAAGANQVVIDIPVGPTAKVRSQQEALQLTELLHATGKQIGLEVRALTSDGRQPVGFGIGPALEARDVLAVLQGLPEAPAALRERSLWLAGEVLEQGGKAGPGEGLALAQRTLDSGEAWRKFQAICEAQGGLREPPRAVLVHEVLAERAGHVRAIDNRLLAKLAKLAGAPASAEAGVRIRKQLNEPVMPGEPLLEVHARTRGEMDYALGYLADNPEIYQLGETGPGESS